jgi:UDP-N-acetylenolpyruvoylglucosamine reductase
MIGDSFRNVKNQIIEFKYSKSNFHKNDSIIFSLIIEGPNESSEQMYIDFGKDSLVINKKYVH